MSKFDLDLLDFDSKEKEFLYSVLGGSTTASASLHGKTPLHLAVQLGETRFSAYLIERGAPVDGSTGNDTSEKVRHKHEINQASSFAISKYLKLRNMLPYSWYCCLTSHAVDITRWKQSSVYQPSISETQRGEGDQYRQ